MESDSAAKPVSVVLPRRNVAQAWRRSSCVPFGPRDAQLSTPAGLWASSQHPSGWSGSDSGDKGSWRSSAARGIVLNRSKSRSRQELEIGIWYGAWHSSAGPESCISRSCSVERRLQSVLYSLWRNTPCHPSLSFYLSTCQDGTARLRRG